MYETVANVAGGMATLIFGDLTSNVPLGYSVLWHVSGATLNTCILNASTFDLVSTLSGLLVYNAVSFGSGGNPSNTYRTQVVQLIRDSDQVVVSEYRFCNTFV